MEPAERRKGLASSLFVFALSSGATFILAFSHWLSRGGQIHISLSPLYVWETMLFVTSILTMTLVVLLRNNENYIIANISTSINERTDNRVHGEADSTQDTHESNVPLWTRVPLRSVLYAICCIGGVVPFSFDLYRTVDNLEVSDDLASESKSLSICKCIRHIFCIVFVIYELVFLLWCRNFVCRSLILKGLLSLMMSANVSLFVNVVLDIVWAANSLELFDETLNGNKSDIHLNISCGQTEEEEKYLMCTGNTVKIDQVRLYFHMYTYQFPVEFALLSICFLWRIWNILCPLGQVYSESQISIFDRSASSIETSTSGFVEECSETDHTPLMRGYILGRWKRIRRPVILTFMCVTRHAFIITLIYVICAFSLQLYMDIRNTRAGNNSVAALFNTGNRTHSHIVEWYSILQTVYTYVFCIVAFIGYILIRKEKAISASTISSDYFPLLIGALGHFSLTLFETVDSIGQFVNKPEKKMTLKILFLVKTCFYYVELYSHTLLVIKSSKVKVRKSSVEGGKQLFLRGIIIFVAVCNAKSWVTDSFLDAEVLTDVNGVHNQDLFGEYVWWYMTQLLYPLVIVYRLFSVIICFEACVRFNRKC